MTIILGILGFHNCDGCSNKVRIALRKIGVEMLQLDRETGNITVSDAENPEVIKYTLQLRLKKSVIVLSPDPVRVIANQLTMLGQVALMLAHKLVTKPNSHIMSDIEQVNHLRIPMDHIITAANNFAQHDFVAQEGFGKVYKGQLLPAHFMSDLEKLAYMRIPLDHITTATNNFAQHNILARGGFGRVYKGQLPLADQPAAGGTTVAVKRLDVQSKQGDHEFLMEIFMLASYKHKNLVSLIGFADEGSEKILVYKNEDNGSLDKHLKSTDLTWERRLRICLGAARGLEYLHSGVGPADRVIHCDVKSSNILLDANWEAKVSDFGLSKIGPRNMSHTFLFTRVCGTHGYVDPVYEKTLVLTKESDVYSFGVVLFEVLCGRFAISLDDERRLLSSLVKVYYRKGKLDEIIFPGLVDQMKSDSKEIFSKIAFKCLDEDREGRPTMRSVVESLESALEHQLVSEHQEIEGIIIEIRKQYKFLQQSIVRSKSPSKIFMANTGGIRTHVLKLTGSNYYHWYIQMRVLLESHELWFVVEDGFRDLLEKHTEAVTNEYKENCKRDRKALHFIFQATNESSFERIITAKSSKDAWDVLNKSFRGEHRVKNVKQQTLQCECYTLRMNETETVDDFFIRTTQVVNQLRMNEEQVEDKRVVEKILRSLPRKFESVVVAVEETKDMKTLPWKN